VKSFVLVALVVACAPLLAVLVRRLVRGRRAVGPAPAPTPAEGPGKATPGAGVSPEPQSVLEVRAFPAEATAEDVPVEAKGEVEESLAGPAAGPSPARLRDRLARSRESLGSRIAALLRRGPVESSWEELEEILIQADVGVETTVRMVEDMREKAGRRPGEDLLGMLKQEVRDILGDADRGLCLRREDGPAIVLVTGVNGTGKTTTIGKLALNLTRRGKHVVLAAADTFRAAASDQLMLWAECSGAHVVAGLPGADPAAVAFDGLQAARARGADVLIVDTAGRLHTKSNLMEELRKIKRVLERDRGPIEETLLVMDATTGQNGLVQARQFGEAVSLSGLVLAKLDGTARGGIVLAVQSELGVPVKLVGIGEGPEDLAPFDPDAFVEALFGDLEP